MLSRTTAQANAFRKNTAHVAGSTSVGFSWAMARHPHGKPETSPSMSGWLQAVSVVSFVMNYLEIVGLGIFLLI